jgi:mannitol/fructose-specific phosphotransferase system IIA component (Ntr-type)
MAGIVTYASRLTMKLSEILPPEHILLDLQATDRWQAMEELLDHLIAAEDFPADWRKEVAQSLHQRESLVSTGVGGGVAIPHAFSESLDDVVAVFGRSIAGIDFEAQDQELVHFVVLFISPRNSYQKHLHALAAIARMFTKPETRQAMMQARDAADLYSLFCNKVVALRD